jgi:HEAT repeat protein
MRLALVFALVLWSVPAVADEAEARKKAEELSKLISEGQGDWDRQNKLVAALRRAPGGAKAWIEVTAAREDLAEKAWSLASASAAILEGRGDDAEPSIRALLKEKDGVRVRYGVSLAGAGGLAGRVIADLIPLLNDDETGYAVQGILQNPSDRRVVQALLEAAGRKGDRGNAALAALRGSPLEEARAYLRSVAKDAQQETRRRVTAIGGFVNPPGAEGEAALRELLEAKDEGVVEAALEALVETGTKADVATLKGLRRQGNEYRAQVLDKALSVAGDEEGAKACLRRAKAGRSAWDKWIWYVAAGRSGLPSVREALEKALGDETDEEVRGQILVAIGETGDAAALDLLSKYLTHPQHGGFARDALGALVRRNASATDGVLARLLDVTVQGQIGLDGFPYTALSKPTPELRTRLVEAYLRLLETLGDRPHARTAVVSALSEMTRPDFGSSEAAAGKWAEWWKAHREEFAKSPPKWPK